MMSAPEIDLMALGQHFQKDIPAENTRALYGHGLAALLRFIDETGYGGHQEAGPPYPIDRLDNDVLVEFYRWLSEQYRPHTVQTYLAALRRFLVWLDAGERLPPAFHLSNAHSRLKAIQGSQGSLRYQHRRPDPELPRILAYYDQFDLPQTGDFKKDYPKRLTILRNRAIVHTLYASAGRVSEVAGLTRQQVMDGQAEEVYIVGKGEKERVILLTDSARAAIRAYLKARLDDYEPLFISHSNRGRNRGKPLSRISIWSVVKAAAKALDLHETTSPHAFRHYRATQLLNRGMPLELVQAYLGHESIETTRRVYAHTHTQVLKQQLQAFDEDPAETIREIEQRQSSSRSKD